MAIHVDDGIIIGKNLKKNFEMSVVENPQIYLGIQISMTEQGIFLHQEQYARKVLERFDMTECNCQNSSSSRGETR